MGYLIASILCLGAISVLMRHSVRKGAAPLALTFVHRSTVALYLILPLLVRGGLADATSHWKARGMLTVVASVSLWVSGLASIKSVQLGPLGVSWTILRCSMILPVLASIFYWQELPLYPVSGPLIMRVFGIILGVAAVFVCGRGYQKSGATESDRSSKREWVLWTAAAFFAQGIWEICLRATRGFDAGTSRPLFVLFVFAASGVLTVPALAFTRTKVRAKELKYGALLGICALVATGCRLLALKTVDGTIVFPLTTVSVMLFAQLAGRFLWQERVAHAGLGLILGIAAILFLTIG